MPKKGTRAARKADRLRKQQERLQVQQAFTYKVVDNSWRNEQVQRLDLHCELYSIIEDHVEPLPLTDPTKFVSITGDGNCFFNALSFVVCGNEDQSVFLRTEICKCMRDNQEIVKTFLPAESRGKIETYLSTSKMEENQQWATEVEFFAAALLLKTNLYLYTRSGNQWKWLKFSVGNETYSHGIYLYHKDQNHFDVVASVVNSPLYSGIHDDVCYSKEDIIKQKQHVYNKYLRKKYENNPCLSAKKKEQATDSYRKRRATPDFDKNVYNQYQRQKYENNPCLSAKKRAQATDFYRKRKGTPDFDKNRADSQRKKYKSDLEYKTKHKNVVRNLYRNNPDFRQEKIRFAKERFYGNRTLYANHIKLYYRMCKSYREKIKATKKVKYSNDSKFRNILKERSAHRYRTVPSAKESVKNYSKEKYRNNAMFKESVKDYSKEKYRENQEFTKKVKMFSREKYKDCEHFRKRVLNYSQNKYKTNLLFRTKLQTKLRKDYYQSYILRTKKKHATQIRRKSVPKTIRTFHKSVRAILDYICTVCLRILYRRQVRECKRDKYILNNVLSAMAEKCLTGRYVHQCDRDTICDCASSRRKEWICFTCDSHLAKGRMPPQAQANNLFLQPIPDVLKRLNGLERQLIAMRIPFMKLLSLPRGGQYGVKGPVVNIPSDLNVVTTSLPRPTEEAQLIKVKLKRKLAYKGHYKYEWVNPDYVIEAIQYLIQNNEWYSNMKFNDEWLSSSNDSELVRNRQNNSDSESGDEQEEDKQHGDTSSDFPVESCLQPLDLGQEYLDTNDKIFCIAPGENQRPQNMFTEKGVDAMAFPVLLPDGKFGLSADRDIRLTPSKYFNARLFCADNRFSSDNQFIFYAQYVTELADIKSKMSIALRQGHGCLDSGEKVTASMLSNSEGLQNILKSDAGYRFLQPIRGSPPYWQRTLKDLYAMILQLGIPTWFITFSAGETRWEEVIETLLHCTNDSRDVSGKCKLIRENPVLCSRMFDHRVKCLFSELLKSPSQPVGPLKDFFYRTEFQQRGSPHIHCLIWIEGAPRFGEDSDEAVCEFVDKYVTCQLPDPQTEPELYDIATSVQVHSKNHSKSCRKKSTTCRFHFPRPPIKETFIAKIDTDESDKPNLPPPTSVEEFDELIKAQSGKSGKQVLKDVWSVINSVELDETATIDHVLSLAHVTYDQFKEALNSVTKRNSIYYKRTLRDCWVNNYNRDLLAAWNANIDIQFVMDPYACVAYILSYISKAEAAMGDLLENARKEAQEGNVDAAAAMKKIGHTYVQNREVSAQEAIYRVCSLHLKQCSREVTFIPTGSKPLKISLPISAVRTKHNDDENVWMTSILDKYYARPVQEHFQSMCLAEFCSSYTILPTSQKPRTQNAKLPVFELQRNLGYIKQRLSGRQSVIRYPRFNRIKQSEEFYMTLAQLYLPHRVPTFKPTAYRNYEEFIRNGNVIEIINSNRRRFEVDSEDIEKAWEDLQSGNIREDAWSMIAPAAEEERLDIESEISKVQEDNENVLEIPELTSDENDSRFKVSVLPIEINKPVITQKQICEMMSNMNNLQQSIFYKIRYWCLKVSWNQHPQPFHVFITGGAGTGKTHLVKCITREATRILTKASGKPDSLPVMLTAPTGTAAFNLGGNTLHSAFSVNPKISLPYVPLAENTLNSLRIKLEHMQILVIDEISMVDHKLLTYIHGRPCQLKQNKHVFGNISVIAVGDFGQLPPIAVSPLFKIQDENFMDLWNPVYSVACLSDIMRQKDDIAFANMLNRIRVLTKEKTLDEGDLNMLKSRTYEILPEEAYDYLHIFPTIKEVNKHNDFMVKRKCDPVIPTLAQDYAKNFKTGQLEKRNTPFSSVQKDDLLTSIDIGINARIMLTRNLDVEDGLVNGAFGTIKGMDKKTDGEIMAVYVAFDNKRCGAKSIAKSKTKNPFGKKFVRLVPIEETLHGKHVTRRQFPFRLGWGATIHKVQGMTLEKVVVSLKKVFQAGMAYVALSRATTLEGLHIINFDPTVIYASPEVSEAINNMPLFISEESDVDETNNKEMVSIVLHNTEGLIPHLNDSKSVQAINSADIVCFTESWLKKKSVPKNFLPNHAAHFLLRSEAYTKSSAICNALSSMDKGGVAIFIKDSLSHRIPNMRTSDLECISCIVQSNQQFSLSVVYRSPRYKMELFCKQLECLLRELDNLKLPNLVLGDFNDEYRCQSDMKTIFHTFGYTQLVKTPTTEAGTILDLVYIKGFPVSPIVKIIPTYYSFHEVVQISVDWNNTL